MCTIYFGYHDFFPNLKLSYICQISHQFSFRRHCFLSMAVMSFLGVSRFTIRAQYVTSFCLLAAVAVAPAQQLHQPSILQHSAVFGAFESSRHV